MTDSETIRQIVRSTYEARSRGDLDGTMAAFADDVVFEFYGEGTGLPSMSCKARSQAALARIITA
jgi:ketosteroid isomerase-like protein